MVTVLVEALPGTKISDSAERIAFVCGFIVFAASEKPRSRTRRVNM
jgi:hypothetical protein